MKEKSKKKKKARCPRIVFGNPKFDRIVPDDSDESTGKHPLAEKKTGKKT